MCALNLMPAATLSTRDARRWLRTQSRLDWRSAGLPEFQDWDQATATVAQLIACSLAPMAWMMGPRGILLANQSAERLFRDTSGVINGHSVLEVLPDSAPFYALAWDQHRCARILSGG